MTAVQQSSNNLYFLVCFFKMNISETWSSWCLLLNHLKLPSPLIALFSGQEMVMFVQVTQSSLSQSKEPMKSQILFSSINHLVPQTYAWCMNQITGGYLTKNHNLFYLSEYLGILRKVVHEMIILVPKLSLCSFTSLKVSYACGEGWQYHEASIPTCFLLHLTGHL